MRVIELCKAMAAVVAVSGCAHSARGSVEPTRDPNPPRTLEQAVARLHETLPPELITRLRTSDESVVYELHFGPGLNIRNGWSLWAGGPLYESLKALGLRHPDDMSGLILRCLWRSIHGVPWQVEEEVRLYQSYWRFAVHPDPKSNRSCVSGIAITQSYSPDFDPAAGPQKDLRVLRQVHMGKCCADGRVWAYEVDRGWFPAEGKDRAVWESEAESRYDPCALKSSSENP